MSDDGKKGLCHCLHNNTQHESCGRQFHAPLNIHRVTYETNVFALKEWIVYVYVVVEGESRLYDERFPSLLYGSRFLFIYSAELADCSLYDGEVMSHMA